MNSIEFYMGVNGKKYGGRIIVDDKCDLAEVKKGLDTFYIRAIDTLSEMGIIEERQDK